MLSRKTPFNVSPSQFSSASNESATLLQDRVWRHIPGRGSDWVDPRNGVKVESVENSVDEIRRYLDADEESRWSRVVGEGGREKWMHPHMVPDRVLEKWGRLFDIVLPKAKRTCCFTRGECSVIPSFFYFGTLYCKTAWRLSLDLMWPFGLTLWCDPL